MCTTSHKLPTSSFQTFIIDATGMATLTFEPPPVSPYRVQQYATPSNHKDDAAKSHDWGGSDRSKMSCASDRIDSDSSDEEHTHLLNH